MTIRDDDTLHYFAAIESPRDFEGTYVIDGDKITVLLNGQEDIGKILDNGIISFADGFLVIKKGKQGAFTDEDVMRSFDDESIGSAEGSSGSDDGSIVGDFYLQEIDGMSVEEAAADIGKDVDFARAVVHFTFKADGTLHCFVSLDSPQQMDGTYTVDGNKVTINIDGVEEVGILKDDGTLTFDAEGFVLKKGNSCKYTDQDIIRAFNGEDIGDGSGSSSSGNSANSGTLEGTYYTYETMGMSVETLSGLLGEDVDEVKKMLYFVFRSDGTCQFISTDEGVEDIDECTYTVDGNVITITTDDVPVVLTMDGDILTLTIEGATMKFKRD